MDYVWASKQSNVNTKSTDNKTNPFLEDFRDYVFILNDEDRGNLDELPRLIKNMDDEFDDSTHPKIKDKKYDENTRKQLKDFSTKALDELGNLSIGETITEKKYFDSTTGFNVTQESFWNDFPKDYKVKEIKTKKVEIDDKKVSQLGEVVGGLATAERRSKYEKAYDLISQKEFIERFKGTWKPKGSKDVAYENVYVNEYGVALTIRKVDKNKVSFTFKAPALEAQHPMSKVKILTNRLGGDAVKKIPYKESARKISTKTADAQMVGSIPVDIQQLGKIAGTSQSDEAKNLRETYAMRKKITADKVKSESIKEIGKWIADNFYKIIEGMGKISLEEDIQDDDAEEAEDILEDFRGMDLEAKETKIGEAELQTQYDKYGKEVKKEDKIVDEMAAMQAIVDAKKDSEKGSSWVVAYSNPTILYDILLKKGDTIGLNLTSGKLTGVKIRLQPVAKLRPAILGKDLTDTNVARATKKTKEKKEGEKFAGTKVVGAGQTLDEGEEYRGEQSKMDLSFYLNFINGRFEKLKKAIQEIDRHEVEV
tara:strand:+ start:384 stop:1997 length:1614 start_codon:yes stop_codon:yes gene_type:complete